MTEYEKKALRITELALEYSNLYNVPDVDENEPRLKRNLFNLRKN